MQKKCQKDNYPRKSGIIPISSINPDKILINPDKIPINPDK